MLSSIVPPQLKVMIMSVLEEQIRETYGRVVYTHKTHEVCADILEGHDKLIKSLKIVLSAITTAGFVGVVVTNEWFVAVIGALMSAVLLALNSYTKDFDLSVNARKHRECASNIWNIRESYLSLLTDLNLEGPVEDEIRQTRDDLQAKLRVIYNNAPSTNSKTYLKAQDRLKNQEDMTFSVEEIDAFLPQSLKRKIPDIE